MAVYTGRLHAVKGLTHLVATWPAIVRRWPTAQLWIVGDGPQRRDLARDIDALDLSGNVVLCGAFDSVDDFLTAADCFVLPSLEEGMSLALLEAMSAGLPVVATDIEGNRQLVRHEREGLLVPTGDSRGLATAIGCLLAEPATAAALGAAARQRVAAEFAIGPWAARHQELFERVLAEHKGGASR